MGRALLLAAAAAATAAAQPIDCTFASSYPRQYVAYKLVTPHPLVIDGKLDDPAWQEVGFTEPFVDISTNTTPKFQTYAKIRYDDEFLYVGGHIVEPQIWANITSTCHCISNTTDQVREARAPELRRPPPNRPHRMCHRPAPARSLVRSQVIYHDNDFETFIDVDGTTHYYKGEQGRREAGEAGAAHFIFTDACASRATPAVLLRPIMQSSR